MGDEFAVLPLCVFVRFRNKVDIVVGSYFTLNSGWLFILKFFVPQRYVAAYLCPKFIRHVSS